MASISTSRLFRTITAATKTDAILPFLAPSVQCTQRPQSAQFSTTTPRCKKDNNPMRGMSAIRGTGLRPRQKLSVLKIRNKNNSLQKKKLAEPPKPVKVTEEPTGTRDHGLWGFFKDRQLLQTPMVEQSHGRAWTVGELRSRNWDTLHQLWWVCVKERNRMATQKIEMKRLEAGYGDLELNERDETVQKTMKAILDTLAERTQAYEDAYALAQQDPSIDLERTDGPQFKEPAYDPFEADVDTVPAKA